MAQRSDLQSLLEGILGNDHVYFQPPPDFMMEYPCIVYHRSNIRTRFGDNFPYLLEKEYTITVIDPDPDSQLPDTISKLQRCVFDRNFRTANLNHDVFNIMF